MWTLWQQTQAWGKPPSELLGLTTGTWNAYCLDEAVMVAGRFIEGKLDEQKHDNPQMLAQKRQRLLERLLHPGEEVSSKSFSDPAAKWGT